MGYLLQLSLNCLLYDFLGAANEDTSDDLSTVQIPNSWRSSIFNSYKYVKLRVIYFYNFYLVLMDFTNVDIYFILYHNLPANLAHLVMIFIFLLAPNKMYLHLIKILFY